MRFASGAVLDKGAAPLAFRLVAEGYTMGARHGDADPAWVAPFLAALRAGSGPAAAARAAGITTSTPYKRRIENARFRAAWQAIGAADGRAARKAAPRRPRGAARIDRFLTELAETSNVSAAAALAEMSVSAVYKLRREDPDFARRWYAALAEGYDNLEMELLGRLRAGDAAGSSGPKGRGLAAKGRAKGSARGSARGSANGPADDAAGDRGHPAVRFDTAAALRCLAAHRENVVREKGRRALAEEVATIASINAKIDKLRLNAEAGAKAMAEARAAKPQPRGEGAGDGN